MDFAVSFSLGSLGLASSESVSHCHANFPCSFERRDIYSSNGKSGRLKGKPKLQEALSRDNKPTTDE
jgi:hypothetical protein